MHRLDNDCLASIVFDVSWRSNEAVHLESFMAQKVNFWRDIFPPGMKEELTGLSSGEKTTLTYGPGQAVPSRKNKDIIRTGTSDFIHRKFLGKPVYPRKGRFLPRGLLGGRNFFPQDMRPCRILSADNETLKADCAHPLADHELQVTARVEDVARKDCEVGGRMNHWMEEILGTGPGMQARMAAKPTDFADDKGFERTDQEDDSKFYEQPRFVEHIDSQAGKLLAEEYSLELKPGMHVLDLMSSVSSHLPGELKVKVTGLGLNDQEMEANPDLDSHLVHDLNRYPELPFPDESFEAVICSLSVEYLTRPYHVIQESARVLKPGGILMISFSNRWFPPKVTRLWQELHEFERMGFVLDLLLHTEKLKGLKTTSIRNWQRPADDPHIDQTWTSDPIYVVRGYKI